MPYRLTKEQKEAIGTSTEETKLVADRFAVCTATVWYYRKKFRQGTLNKRKKHDIKKAKFSEEFKDMVSNSPLTPRVAAARYNCSPTVVRRWRHERGIAVGPKGRPKGYNINTGSPDEVVTEVIKLKVRRK